MYLLDMFSVQPAGKNLQRFYVLENNFLANCLEFLPQRQSAKQNIPQRTHIHIPNHLPEICIIVHNPIHDMSHQDSNRSIILQKQPESCDIRT